MQIKKVWEPHICHKNSASNPASLETMDDLVGDVWVVHQAGRNANHGAIWSRTHAIHATHSYHPPHSSHSTMADWWTSTLRLVDFPLRDDSIRVLRKRREIITQAN